MTSFNRLASTLVISLALGAALHSRAQEISRKPLEPQSVKLYALECGLTEFSDADYFSDTGEFAGKAMALPTLAKFGGRFVVKRTLQSQLPCFLIRHGNEWLLWDTGNDDRLAKLPNVLLPSFGGCDQLLIVNTGHSASQTTL